MSPRTTASSRTTEPFADWADNFGGNSDYVLKADAFAGPDIANDINTELPFSGGPWVLDSYDPSGTAVLVRNEAYWDEERIPLLDSVTMQLQADTDTELNALLAGEIAAIYPQPAPGIADTLGGGDTVEFEFGAGATYEGLWFNQGSLLNPETALADPAVREALLFAVNRDEILAEVITPSFPETEILNCGGWVPTVGDWCDQTDFEDAVFDPELVASTLEGAGWALGGDGIYEKDGQRLSITWQTVAGNARREAIQALVIPQLAELGIELVRRQLRRRHAVPGAVADAAERDRRCTPRPPAPTRASRRSSPARTSPPRRTSSPARTPRRGATKRPPS